MPTVPSGRSLPGPWHKWLIGTCFPAHQLMRLRASPHEVALGCAVGVFVSITPLLGAQTLIAALLAGFLRASVPAAVLGTFFGNPVSWPIIWTSTYAMGLQIIRPDGVLGAGDFEQNVMLLWEALLERSPELLDATGALLWPLLLPMLVGSLPLGLPTAAIVYYISRHLIRGWESSSPYDSATRLSRATIYRAPVRRPMRARISSSAPLIDRAVSGNRQISI